MQLSIRTAQTRPEGLGQGMGIRAFAVDGYELLTSKSRGSLVLGFLAAHSSTPRSLKVGLYKARTQPPDLSPASRTHHKGTDLRFLPIHYESGKTVMGRHHRLFLHRTTNALNGRNHWLLRPVHTLYTAFAGRALTNTTLPSQDSTH